MVHRLPMDVEANVPRECKLFLHWVHLLLLSKASRLCIVGTAAEVALSLECVVNRSHQVVPADVSCEVELHRALLPAPRIHSSHAPPSVALYLQ